MKKMLVALIGICFFPQFLDAGDGRISENPTRSRIPYWGNDSELYVAGFVCGGFRPKVAEDVCRPEFDCLKVAEPAFRRGLADSKTDSERVRWLRELSYLFSNYPDRLDDAAEMMKRAVEIQKKAEPANVGELKAQLGMIYLRIGENKNCILNHNSDSCLFPLKDGGVHKNKSGSVAAYKIFLELLSKDPENDHLRWLLNVAAMAQGNYEKIVPKKYLINASRFSSKIDFPRFVDVGGPVGIQRRQHGGGTVLVDDINGDGLLDIIVAPRIDCQGVSYFENDGKGGFIDKSEPSGLAAQLGVTNVILGDYNNDGIPDLYLSRGGWQQARIPRWYNTLLKGVGGGKFADVTNEVGLRTDWNANVSANWVDFDKDGWLDLFVCNEGREVELFRNKKGKFENVAAKLGIQNNATCKSSAWGDLDGDGWPDLFMANHADKNRMYFNRKGKAFQLKTPPELERHPTEAFTGWFFDVNNDGLLDIFINAYNRDIDPYVKAILGKPFKGEPPRLFLNEGGNKFKDVTAEYGLNIPIMGMAGNFGDLNGDGWPDFYLGTGSVSFGDLVPNLAYLNQEGKGFIDVTTSANMGNLQKGHGIAFADIENSGKQDVVANFGGAFGGDRFYPSLFKNPGFGAKWITIRLEGTKSNRLAIGARIRVRIREEGEKLRDIYHWVGPGGSFGSSPIRAEVGLGNASSIVELEVIWPNASASKTILRDVEMNRIYSLKEGDASLKALDIPALALRMPSGKSKGHRHH